MKKIELLSPAKDIEVGKAAVNYGADAVYIGAPKFGARSAAGNSVKDIGLLARYAHKFHAKVYVTMNTVIYEHELEDAQKLIYALYEEEVDALIIQDMGILEMDIPPIALFASTQTHNYTADKIKFLESAGIERIILAREMPLSRIKEISAETKSELEFFVHGALCVSFSGQCYFSQATTGRSANRGECSQSCRVPYNLEDSEGKILIRDKHLLSLKDLDLSHYLKDLLDAGISSFKIEGRLKDANYVKNITAFYRMKLDAILNGNSSLCKASSGTVHFTFTPDPERTFSRGYTDYFLHGEDEAESMASFDTPKSLGKPVAEVLESGSNFIVIAMLDKLVNGDGICFFDDHNDLRGMFINKIEGNRIITEQDFHIPPGSMIFRNNDLAFEQMLLRDKSARKIEVMMNIRKTAEGLEITAEDEDGITAAMVFGKDADAPQNPERTREQFTTQLKKSGDTIFDVTGVTFETGEICFLPVSQINELRRKLLKLLEENRIASRQRLTRNYGSADAVFPYQSLDYRGNVTNSKAEAFYRKHGVSDISKGFELEDDFDGKSIMTTKYCIKKELDICPFDHPDKPREYSEPLFLRDRQRTYRLAFDCDKCQMRILY